jgi:hypothetical protein
MKKQKRVPLVAALSLVIDLLSLLNSLLLYLSSELLNSVTDQHFYQPVVHSGIVLLTKFGKVVAWG